MSKAGLLRAFDEIDFGSDRTLNLRDSFPTAADARFRAEAWLRQRQPIGRDEVLIVTGRGKGSTDGIAVVKEEVISLLHTLRRQGVVSSWHEQSQGAIVVKPASLNDLLTAPRRHRAEKKSSQVGGGSLAAARTTFKLEAETEKLLRQLAERSLAELGVRDWEGLVESEMSAKLTLLVRALPENERDEQALRAVIINALEE